MKTGKIPLLTSIILISLCLFLPSSIFISGKVIKSWMEQDLGNADVSFHGENLFDGSGFEVTGAGDVNGDGYDDILIGTFPKPKSSPDVYLIFGKASGWATNINLSESDASFQMEYRNYRLLVDSAGDVNGDGYDDFLFGELWKEGPKWDDNDIWKVSLIFGKSSGWSKNTNISFSDASFWVEGMSFYWGNTFTGVGDVNGDGFDDFLIGAPDNDDAGYNAGQIYLILGKSSGWTLNTNISKSDASFLGDKDDRSELYIRRLGDVNGDGYDDFLIRPYLILGKPSNWTVGANLSASDASFWTDQKKKDSFSNVVSAGDVNGDGYDDILFLGGRSEHTVWVTSLIFGKPNGWAMDTDLNSSNATFLAEDVLDYAGVSLACAGDVNGDGYDDILIGAPFSRDNGYLKGQTYLILGKPSGWAKDTDLSTSNASFIGENVEDMSGMSIAGAGDVNGDGFDDILIGAAGNDEWGNGTGKTYLIFNWTMDKKYPLSDESESKSWTSYIIDFSVILFILIILFFVIMQSKKKVDVDADVIDDEIESQPLTGITRDEFER